MTRICLHCGAEFTKKAREGAERFRGRQFCCKACYLASRQGTAAITRACDHCGTEYTRPKNKAYAANRYCSRACAAKRDQRIPDVEFKARYRQVKVDGRR